MPQMLWRPLSLLIFFLVFTIEALRIRSPTGSLNKLIVHTFRPFIRAHETRQFAGIAYYTFGITIASTCFPRACGTLGILSLACLDPVAAFAGTFFQPLFPKLRLRHGKSVGGLLCACICSALFLFLVVMQASHSSLNSGDAWMIAVILAWVGSLSEFLTPSPQLIFGSPQFPLGLDDNAVIPIMCAAAARWLLRTTYHNIELSPLLLFHVE